MLSWGYVGSLQRASGDVATRRAQLTVSGRAKVRAVGRAAEETCGATNEGKREQRAGAACGRAADRGNV